MAELRLDAITKRYGPKTVVDDVRLAIPDGSFCAMLGPSGSGKTTILQMIAGLTHPDDGRIHLDGRDVTWMRPDARNIGVVFQSYALFPHLDVAENVAYGLRARRIGRKERLSRVTAMLDLVGLRGLHRRKPSQLSGGQRQRVALARALVIEPDLLLLDEPLSALDRKIRGGMQRELARIHCETGLTTVMVTHDQEEALDLADHVVLLHDGVVQQEASPAAMYGHPGNQFVADFLGNQELRRVQVISDAASSVAVLPGLHLDLEPGPLAGYTGLADLAVAPEAVKLRRVGPGDPDRNRGRITRLRFLGPTAEAEVAVEGTVLRSLMLSREALQLSEGAEVTVSIDPEGTHVFRLSTVRGVDPALNATLRR
jgi:ABC-type Fe3+/spermidine/putrescine transport system ATPase subunit